MPQRKRLKDSNKETHEDEDENEPSKNGQEQEQLNNGNGSTEACIPEVSGSSNLVSQSKAPETKSFPNSDATPTNMLKQSRKRKKKRTYDIVTEEDQMPTEFRKTKNGGYLHTNASKGKISKANAGKAPWNKGRNRSSADRAKIAAGVRARNRALLLAKLKRLGLSEEEWNEKKKEVKYLRERIRRAKATKKKHSIHDKEAKERAAKAEQMLKEAIDSMTEKDPIEPADEKDSDSDVEREKSNADDGFAREVAFTPYNFGPDGKTYDKACPSGGPGGLVCCEACAESYTWFLGKTVKDMESHRASRIGKEVQDLLKFVKDESATLEKAHAVAKQKIPPLPMKVVKNPAKTVANDMASAPEHNNLPWNMTSTIDVGASTKLTNTRV